MTETSWPSTEYALDIGDRLPNVFGRDQHGGRFSILQSPPGPFIIMSVPADQAHAAAPAIRALDDAVRAGEAIHPNAAIAIVGPAERVHAMALEMGIEVAVIADTRGELAALLRAGRGGHPVDSRTRDGIITVVTDPDQTIRTVIAATRTGRLGDALLEALNHAEAAGARTGVHAMAPVLRIPRLLSPAQCRALVAIWERENQPGRVGTAGRYGESLNKIADKRICRDHFIRETDTLHGHLVATLAPRIHEAVRKAFHYDISHYEPFIVVGYPASDGGFFGAHRDNTNPAHMHRRFALTVALNTGEYTGGGIWFPEYADAVYDVAAGDGIVFSCSILHEARRVTEGTRMILSGFMWGAADEALRQRNVREAAERQRRAVPLAPRGNGP